MSQYLQGTVHQQVGVQALPGLRTGGENAIFLNHIGQVPSADCTESPLYKRSNLLIKRAFDLVVSFFVIVLWLSWMIPLLWIINRVAYGHGVFFIQKRNGLNNRIFKCIKFKTMVDADGANTKGAEENDPRITPLGVYLRRSGLDELPQFLNVLSGQMSVIGPRPHMLYHTAIYRNVLKDFMIRHTVKPGITGLAQVSGFCGSISSFYQLRQRVNLDLVYVGNWNILMDMKIFFLTIIRTFRGGS